MSDISEEKPAPLFDASHKWHFGNEVVERPIASPSKPTPRRNKTFYLQPVIFQVGNTLFRVLKEGFQVPGTVFEAMFALPTDETANPEGSSDDNPIHLSGVDESSFVAFLSVLYPSFVTETATPDTQYRNLVAALDLATMWEFINLRKQIISMLSPIVEKRNNLEVIYLAKKYRVAEWLRASYKKLVLPSISTELPMSELTSSPFPLGWATIAKIYNIREILIRGGMVSGVCSVCNQSYGPNHSGDRRFSGCDCRIITLVDKHFQEELIAMADDLPDFFNPPLVPQTAVTVKETSNLNKKRRGGK